MPTFILGVAVLIGVFLAARWFASAPPAQLAKVLKVALVVIFVPLTVFLVLRGGAQFLFFLLPALLPWIMRFRALNRMRKNWQRMSSGTRPGAGQSSQVETAFLRMNLDLGSGEMDGEVLQGGYRGRTLGDLSLDQLIGLLGECAADEQSAQVLMAYLERYHPDEWRERAGAAGAGDGSGRAAAGSGAMTRDEALEVLGLEGDPTEDEIKEAHRDLMTKLHPDRGGSTYLATKINQAKDLLLGI